MGPLERSVKLLVFRSIMVEAANFGDLELYREARAEGKNEQRKKKTGKGSSILQTPSRRSKVTLDGTLSGRAARRYLGPGRPVSVRDVPPGKDTERQPMPGICCDRATDARFDYGSWLGRYLRGVSDQWLKVAPLANYGMLLMFRERDRLPSRDLEPVLKPVGAPSLARRMGGKSRLEATPASISGERWFLDTF